MENGPLTAIKVWLKWWPAELKCLALLAYDWYNIERIAKIYELV